MATKKTKNRNPQTLYSSKNKSSKDSPPTIRLRHKDLVGFETVLEQRIGFKPRSFQVDGIKAQLLGRDVLVHAGTGSGKTVIAAGPHFHPLNAGKVTIMVSPLLALQNEQPERNKQVQTFKDDFGLEAVAINSSHEGCADEALENLKGGKYQILLISPEMLLSHRFMSKMMNDRTFTSRIISVVVDEAHVVSVWGAGFRKRYGDLGMIRTFLPPGTPIVAMSATLSARVRADVLDKLEFPKDGYTIVNIGNDRPNVSIVVRAIQHAMNTYKDLDFLVPENISKPEDLPKAMVYADNITNGVDIEDHIEEILPEHLRHKGLIRPFSAAFSYEYRAKLLEMFKSGVVRILICTDAAGMGCNIPDVDIVVQWKLPASLSTFVQRAGRAARASGREGLAVLLVEKSSYTMNIDTDTPPSKKKRTKKDLQAYAVACGIKRGGSDSSKDLIVGERREPNILANDQREGIHVLVQTTICRRQVIARVYDNAVPVSCCDLCTPALLDRTRPSSIIGSLRQSIQKRGQVSVTIRNALIKWRTTVYDRDFPFAMFGPSALLSDSAIELLASVGPVVTKTALESTLINQWSWFQEYGAELYDVLQLHTPIVAVTAQQGGTAKRRHPVAAKEQRCGDGKQQENRRKKRPRCAPPEEQRPITEAPAGSQPTARPVTLPAFAPATPARSTPQTSHNPYAYLKAPAALHYYNQTQFQTPSRAGPNFNFGFSPYYATPGMATTPVSQANNTSFSSYSTPGNANIQPK